VSYAADLHTHSPFAHGTSGQLSFENLARWARTKGIELLSSGDFTQPLWLAETRSKLREIGDGLFEHGGVNFILGTEVNCSAEQGGRHRRVHVLVFAPGIETAERIGKALASKGKLDKAGRPTLRLSPRDLLQLLLEIDERCFIIPAHLWTPHFGLYGFKSGFDSLEECFGDMAGHVYAVETGLSSEPAMNWRVPSLDCVSILSFSDAHSLDNLGRELTVFPGQPAYDSLVESLKAQSFEYTVEFFPEEGKYHYSGHRKCGVSLSPHDAAVDGARCPRCGGKPTSGVMQRVDDLAEREVETWLDEDGFIRASNGRPPFKMMLSLRQIVAEALGCGPDTKRARAICSDLVSRLGSELAVLTSTTVADIAAVAGERVAEGVARVRSRDISIEPGYDGRYGRVSIWPEP
jgi:uncharacterized protein (TIGR00375 family)